MRLINTRLFFISLLISSLCFSQKDKIAYFQSADIRVKENISTFDWSGFEKLSIWNNGYFGCIQFTKIPSQKIQDELRNMDLLLLEYIPDNTYLFYFPKNVSLSYLKKIEARAIFPLETNQKIAKNIKQNTIGEWAVDGNRVLLNVSYFDIVPKADVIKGLRKLKLTIIEQLTYVPIIKVSIPIEDIEKLAALPYIKSLEQISAPFTPDDTRARNLHRTNTIDTNYPSGRHYTGAGIGVMVRDDGIVGPHIDFKGRIDNGKILMSTGNHGDGVAGIMSGAGNLDPDKKGMAPGSLIFAVDYDEDFDDTATNELIDNGTVQITNSSFSNGCNSGYTSTTETVDSQANNNLNLLHVFSAGNSNDQDCGYGAGNQWGNISGGHKQGKNVVATANVYFDTSIVSSSSRGPAYDGRIKPDIAANGDGQISTGEDNTYVPFGGTSAAAPGISGVSASLYEAYSVNNGGDLPEAALIKSVLLNTANDLGNRGPDFKYGWGQVNALRAAMTIEDNRFLKGSLSQGLSNDHVLSIPSGTKEVRFMVYWNDPAATVLSSKALVNDIDLVVTDPLGSNLLPWVLDHTPDPNVLDLPATKGVDRLNNVEQVLISNPYAGNYTVTVSGFNIPMGPQDYFVVYEIITEDVILTNPIGGESLVPGAIEVIHWDAPKDLSGDFLLEYSINNGASWTTIANVTNTLRLYEWIVPDTISGNCLVRITTTTKSDQNEEVFSIAKEISGVVVTQVCSDEMSISCNPIQDAVSYEVYVLGQKYMELVGTSVSNTVAFPITDPDESIWYAMKAVGNDGWKTKRTIASNYSGGLLNCTLYNDLSLNSIETPSSNSFCDGDSTVVSVRVLNSGINDQQDFKISYQFNGEPVVEEMYSDLLTSGSAINFSFPQSLNLIPGSDNDITVWVTVSGDEDTTNDEKSISFYDFSDISFPWIFDVEQHQETTSSIIENCWNSIPYNVNDVYRWNVVTSGGSTPSSQTGPDTANSGSNYFYTEASVTNLGDIAELYTPVIDISDLNVPQLSFYYHMYGSAMGSLHVDILNQGVWNNDEVVITGQQQTSGADVWKEQILILSAYTGEIQIRFRGIRGADFQGDMSLDDIAIMEAPTCSKPADLQISNVAPIAVDIQWVAGGVETNWQIEYGVSGFVQGAGTVIETTSNPYNLTGLMPSTSYDIYLRANCDINPGVDDSFWVGPVSFVTLDSCPKPSNLNIINTTTTSFDVLWDIGYTETNWEIEYGLKNFVQGSGTIIETTTNSHTLMNLVSSTAYDVYIRAVCEVNSGDNNSVWVGPVSMNTLANYCDGDHFYDSGGATGNYENNEDITTVISPEGAALWVEVTFLNFSLEDGFDKLTIYNGPDVSSSVLGVFTGNNSPGTVVSTHPSGSLTFRFTSDNGVNKFGWDAVVSCISCPTPQNIIVSNITTVSAEIQWDAGNTETLWQIEYGEAGFTQGTGMVTQASFNSVVLTDLDPQTNYDVYLQANCGAIPGVDDSFWMGPISLETLISCPVPSGVVISNNTATSVEVQWTAGSNETIWEIEYGETGFLQGKGTTIEVTTNPYMLSDLDPQTDYDLYLRANCKANTGDEDNSDWVFATFSTLCDVFEAPYVEEFLLASMPACWSESGAEPWNYSTNADHEASNAGDHTIGGGTNYAWIDGSTPNGSGHISNLSTPWIDVSDLSEPTVAFSVFSHNTNDATYNILEVILRDRSGSSTSLLQLQESSNGWKDFVFDISGLITNDIIQIEFMIEENSSGSSEFNDILIDDVLVNENNVLATQNPESIKGLRYFPNPIKEILNIIAEEKVTSVNIYSILGKQVLSNDFLDDSILQLDMSFLNSGVYFIEVLAKSKTSLFKVIKE